MDESEAKTLKPGTWLVHLGLELVKFEERHPLTDDSLFVAYSGGFSTYVTLEDVRLATPQDMLTYD